MNIINLNFNNRIYKPSFINQQKNISLPISFKGDTFEFSNTADKINQKLFSKYGIDSEIKNTILAKYVYGIVSEFCEVNNDKQLFKNLTIKDMDTGANFYEYNPDKNVLRFNSTVDYINIRQLSKSLFNQGEICTSNYKFLFYKAFAEYLNNSYNPHAYKINEEFDFEDDDLSVYRISNSLNCGDFCSNYIAAKMCAMELPAAFDEWFGERTGNIDLKYPEVKRTWSETKNRFDSIEEAKEFLLKEYGIKADFITLENANDCAQAIIELAKVAQNKNVFNGLQIKIGKAEEFGETRVFGWSIEGKENICIEFNPAHDFKHYKIGALKDYNICNSASSCPRANFAHELAHYLDFADKKRKKYTKHKAHFQKGDEKIVNKVSTYAMEEPCEFCAEYVAGRLSGIKYPKVVDRLFNRYWNGPKLDFGKI